VLCRLEVWQLAVRKERGGHGFVLGNVLPKGKRVNQQPGKRDAA